MKKRILWVSALALTATITPQINALADATNLIVITERRQSDPTVSRTDLDDRRGPGMVSPGDMALHLYLGDNGYSCRYIPVTELDAGFANPFTGNFGNPTAFLANTNYFNAKLLFLTGAASSADNPNLASFNVPTLVGEAGLLGNGAAGSVFLYTTDAGTGFPRNIDINGATGNLWGDYMTVTAAGKLHPIFQGIPLDAQDRVLMVRAPYPEEELHRPPDAVGGKPNFEYYWLFTTAPPATGTEILAVMSDNTNASCLAVADVGAVLADASVNGRRLVHLPWTTESTSKSRRTFNSMSDIGKVITLRAAKWAMGETLAPYVPLGVIKTTQVSPTKIELKWTGSTEKNYKVLGTADLSAPPSTWETVVQDIPGVAGVDATSVKLDISNGPQYAFFRVMPVP